MILHPRQTFLGGVNHQARKFFVGMPTEAWGFSNNAVGRFGPPDWEQVSFQVDGDVQQSIRLNH